MDLTAEINRMTKAIPKLNKSAVEAIGKVDEKYKDDLNEALKAAKRGDTQTVQQIINGITGNK